MTETIRIEITGDSGDLQAAVRQASTSLRNLNRDGSGQARQFSASLDDTNRRISRGFAGMVKRVAAAGVGVAGAYAGIAAAKNAVKTTEELARATLGLSRNLGLSTEKASRWAAVARARGVDTDQLNVSFTTLSRQVEGALGGNEKLLKSFESLGITQKDLRRGQEDFSFLLESVAQGFAGVEGGTQRAALAQQLLGRSYQTTLPIFTQGKRAMEDQLRLADKYGVTFRGKPVQSIRELISAQRELEFAQMGLQVQFTEALAPALTDLARRAGELIRVMNDDRLTPDEKFERFGKILEPLADHMVDLVEDAVPRMAEAAADLAPEIAKALGRGFLNADPLGQALILAYVGSKVGLFRMAGATLGGAMGTGAATTVATTLPGTMGGKVAGMRGQLKGVGRLMGAAIAAGITIDLAQDILKKEGGDSFLKDLGDAAGEIGKRVIPLGQQQDRVGIKGRIVKDKAEVQRYYREVGQAIRDGKRTVDDEDFGIVRINRQMLVRELQFAKNPEVRQTIENQLRLIDKQIGEVRAVKFALDLSGSKQVTRRQIDSIADEIAKLPPAAGTQAQRTMTTLARRMEAAGQVPKGTANRVADAIADEFKRMHDRSTREGVRMVQDFAGIMQGLDATTRGGLSSIGASVNAMLSALGVNEVKFDLKSARGLAKTFLGGGAAIVGALTNERARGGFLDGTPDLRDNTLVMAAKDEFFATRHQQTFLEHALAVSKQMGEQPFGSLNDLARNVTTPHNMARGGRPKGGVVPLGKSLQRRGFNVGEHPAFGGVNPVHVPNSYHYRSQALDINADSFPGGEAAALDKLAAELKREGWHVLWRVPNHFDHIHVDTASGIGKLGSFAVEALLPKIAIGGPKGALRGLAQGALDKVREAGNELLGQQEAGGGDTGPMPRGGKGGTYGKRELMGLWRGAGGDPALANTMAAIALAESSGKAGAKGPPDGRGLWQIEWPIWSKTLGRLGNPFDPEANAKMAVEIEKRQGLDAWVVYNTGAYQRYMKRGGFAGRTLQALAAGGRPKASRTATGRHEQPPKDRKRAPKAPKKGGKRPPKLRGVPELAQLAGLVDPDAGKIGKLIDDYGQLDRTFERTAEDFYPDARRLPSLQAAGHEIERIGEEAIDWSAVKQRMGELVSLRDHQATIRDMVLQAARLLPRAQEKLQAEINKRQAEINRMKERVRENLKRIGTLRRVIDKEKEKPARRRDRGKLGRWENELNDLRRENRELTGTSEPTSLAGVDRGRIGRLETQNTTWRTELESGTASDTTKRELVGRGFGGQWLEAYNAINDLGDQLAKISPDEVRLEGPQPTPAGINDSGLADLIREQNRIAARTAAINERLQPIFEGFRLELPYLGGFQHGMFPRTVAKQGLALLHPDETVIADPQGAFGSQLRPNVLGNDRPVQVTLVIKSDVDSFVRVVDARIDGRAAEVVDRQIGRNARIISTAPGR